MRLTLSMKILLSIGGLLLVVAVATSTLTFVRVRQIGSQNLEQKGAALADSLNYAFEVLLAQDDRASLQRVVENMSTIPGILRVLVVGRDQQVIASSSRLDVGNPVDSPLTRAYLQQQQWQRITENSIPGQLTIIQPLRGGRFMGGVGGDIVGAVEISLDRRSAEVEARSAAFSLLAITTGSYLLLSLVLFAVLRWLVVNPLHALSEVAQRFRDGQRHLRLRLNRRDELGVLAGTFDEMAMAIERSLATLEEQVAARTAALEEQRAGLEQAVADLQRSIEERDKLSETILRLSTPVIKVHDEVILLPLIGTIDAARARQIEAALLAGIEKQRVSRAIIDLTGVSLVDTEVAGYLIRAMRAARLLGADVLLVGISPEVADAVIHLGVDFSSVVTLADLQSGLLYALQDLDRRSRTRARSKGRNGHS